MCLKRYLFLSSLSDRILRGIKVQYWVFILSVISLPVFGESRPRLDSPDRRERVKAVELVTDQTVLAKLALAVEEKDFFVRRAAILKLTDQTLLTKLALEDENPHIRAIAVLKLTDQTLLAKLAVKEHYEVRSAAVEVLTDQVLLARIAVDDKDLMVRKAAIKKLTDQTLLTKLALEDKDPRVRAIAVQELTDQALLVKLAMTDEQPLVRATAAENLTDQTLLAKLATEDKDEKVRAAAAGRLTDQALLAKLAVGGENSDIRRVAVENLTDQALLVELSKDRDFNIRYGVVKNLADPNVLAKLAVEDKDERIRRAAEVKLIEDPQGQAVLDKTRTASKERNDSLSMCTDQPKLIAALEDSWWRIRQTAARRITDQAVLVKLITEDKDEDIRLAAVENLTDQAVLAKLMAEDKNPHIRSTALEKLTDQTLLAKLAVEGKDAFTRHGAAYKLTDQAALAKLVVEDKDPYLRRAAAMNLTDQTVLVRVAMGDENPEVRQAAVSKITDQALLAKLIVESKDFSARQAAVYSLTDQTLLAKLAAEDKDENIRKTASKRLANLNQKPPRVIRQFADTKLHAAAAEGNEETVKLLLSKGANVNAPGLHDDTPLHRAVMRHLPIVKLLVSSGADVNAINDKGRTPLHLIATMFPLDANVENQQIETIKILLEAGADIEAKDYSGKTPLCAAAEDLYRRESIDILLGYGAKFENMNDVGLQLMVIPDSYGDKELKAWFDKHVPDVNQKDKQGIPLLHKAVIGGRVKVVRELLSRGADVNATNLEKQTALHLAVRDPWPEVINLLIQYKADVNARDERGKTPLYCLARTISPAEEKSVRVPKESLMLLLNHGAMVDMKDDSRLSVLEQLQYWQPESQNTQIYRKELITLLSQNQADLPAKINAAKKDLYDENVYTRRNAAIHLYYMGDSSGVPVMIESLKSSEYPLTLSVANAALQEMTGNDFAGGESLRYLSKNQQKEIIGKWMKWWEKNESSIKADKIDRDRLVKVLKNDPAQRQQFFARQVEKEKSNPKLPVFEDPQRTPQKTLEKFIAAVKAGDNAKALSFMGGQSAETYEQVLKKLSGPEKQSFAENLLGKPIFFEAAVGDDTLYYEILIEQDDKICMSPITFVKDSDGNWIIVTF
jgi:ankyrin repeat protein